MFLAAMGFGKRLQVVNFLAGCMGVVGGSGGSVTEECLLKTNIFYKNKLYIV